MNAIRIKNSGHYNIHPLSSANGNYPITFKDLKPVRSQPGTNLPKRGSSFNTDSGNYNYNDSYSTNLYQEETEIRSGYDSTFPADPVSTGPGLWYVIHLSAHEADTPEKIKEYIIFLRIIIAKHPCGKCRHHGSKYLEMFPPENHITTKNRGGIVIGMFFHSWMFHNTVNDRLNKEIMPFQTAWNMFESVDEAVCLGDCGKESEDSHRQSSAASKQVRLSSSPYEPIISLVPKTKFGPVIRNDISNISYLRPTNYYPPRYQ